MQLCAQTGLRRGEALGLRWSDIDFDARKLRVANTLASTKGGLYLTPPKTEASKRKIAMNDTVVALLQSHRIAQVEEAGAAGNQFLAKDFVFCTRTGEPVHPDNFYRSVTRVCERAGLARSGPHVLRHTFATLLLESNVPHHVVSRILGHSSIRITVDIYGHLSDEGQEAAMSAMAHLIEN
jgi:integrase